MRVFSLPFASNAAAALLANEFFYKFLSFFFVFCDQRIVANLVSIWYTLLPAKDKGNQSHAIKLTNETLGAIIMCTCSALLQ